MMKLLFLSMLVSFLLNYKNLFIMLLSLEVGVLSFFFFTTSVMSNKFILLIFIFVTSSILGLILFMLSMKMFSTVMSYSWCF